MNKKLILILVFVSVAVLIPVLNTLKVNDNGKGFFVAKVEEHLLRSSVLASGSLVYENEVKLTSEVIGKVNEVLVEEGDVVIIGQVLLRIDPRALQAIVSQYQAEVRAQELLIDKQTLIIENHEKKWKRGKSLYINKHINEEEFDFITHERELALVNKKSSKEALKQSNALLKRAKEELSKTIIRSPINGLVTKLSIKVGETAISSAANIAGSSLMTIANTSSLIGEVNIDEADIAYVVVGQPVEIKVISYPNESLSGTVKFVAISARKLAGRQGVTFPVKISLVKRDDIQLFSGMSSRAEIFIQEQSNAIAVPLESMLSNETDGEIESYVMINKNNIAEKRVVELGLLDDEYQAVTAGLTLGENIIIGPYKLLRHLKDGERITVLEDKD